MYIKSHSPFIIEIWYIIVADGVMFLYWHSKFLCYSSLSSDNTSVTAWATGTNDTWSNLQKGFKHLSVEYAALGDKSSQEVPMSAG